MKGIQKISILGTEYTVSKQAPLSNPKLFECDGYHEPYSKAIVVSSEFEEDDMTVENLDEYIKKVMRHEIVHAFLYESGLAENSEWGHLEELVDWIALQLPKIYKACKEVGAL